MKTYVAFALVVFALVANADDRFTLTAMHDLATARAGEVLVVPFAEVQRRLPGAKPFHVVVKKAATGKVVPSQVTNYEHDHKGLAADDLVFQHDFAAGEKSAAFVVERTTEIVAPYPTRVFARFVPERYDDFAWENDRIAHRMYGPALDTPAAGRERLRGSGIDIWGKRVQYPIIDRWYLKGHDGFHQDDGEGFDLYSMGPSRGAGGTGAWDGERLRVSANFATWKVLANGPLRAVFELGYAPWDAGNGVMVSETKRFYVEAGRNLHLVESTFAFAGASELVIGIGITMHPNVPGTLGKDERAGTLTYWEVAKSGGLGIVVALEPRSSFAGFAEESPGRAGVNGNALILARVKPGDPLRYHVGAGWERSGDFAGRAEWERYIAGFAQRIASPVRVRFTE